MKSIVIDEYEAKRPEVHPAQPNMLMLGFVVEDSNEVYVFPMERQHAEEYYQALGEALQRPKVHMPTPGDIRAARAR